MDKHKALKRIGTIFSKEALSDLAGELNNPHIDSFINSNEPLKLEPEVISSVEAFAQDINNTVNMLYFSANTQRTKKVTKLQVEKEFKNLQSSLSKLSTNIRSLSEPSSYFFNQILIDDKNENLTCEQVFENEKAAENFAARVEIINSKLSANINHELDKLESHTGVLKNSKGGSDTKVDRKSFYSLVSNIFLEYYYPLSLNEFLGEEINSSKSIHSGFILFIIEHFFEDDNNFFTRGESLTKNIEAFLREESIEYQRDSYPQKTSEL